ncbi:Crp/Fnr family transcriptional regulator [Riemerella anatipestifer]|uniref:Crp/Fnr family transcriptional regulator n=1 Tax=Riemerella anatipestifer TaxID=34085 RepID=UPI00129EC3E6|nr:cyclic nucleotide-binding domain-containing protein [Riemerella anatipestifer]MBT0550957.1 Crp/Fnr family transcriptional regulator [Riemerella anatipestifer]MBT0553110.1 Crp/Fnr family transcriptional regulator [Riemerella anatipestifer]MCE3023802.1 cyclic nucleotide-binding domain-containing protein [Riemerella anatipestifer]MCU7559547.1 cyclic nucleotide-binding domain-containing protein [Riemerella anatipestifer]MDY3448733.1 cyclic nucleotide-binding domain-containing protein [Riemerell
MNHEKLINYLNQFGKISEDEEKDIIKYFIPIKVKKKDILIERHSICNKLFFVNDGLLRTYYIDSNGNEFTRRIAWERGFLTNMDSFRKNGVDNNETIECIENAKILQISKEDLEKLIFSSENLKNIYTIILEKYIAINIRRYQHISNSSPLERLICFNKNYPDLKNRINDNILASFLAISRSTLIRTRREVD